MSNLTEVPSSLVAGDTLNWTLTSSDNPATAWTASAFLQAPGLATISFAGTASGSAHSFVATAATTASWTPGQYNARVKYTETATGNVVTVAHGPVKVLDALTTNLASHATRTLALLEAAIEGRVPSHLASYSIDGRNVSKIPLSELIQLRDKYRQEVAAETSAQTGRSNVKQILATFSRS